MGVDAALEGCQLAYALHMSTCIDRIILASGDVNLDNDLRA